MHEFSSDALALNIGTDSWQIDQIHNAYSAATGTEMKMFLSFDFSVFPCDVNSVVTIVNQFSANQAQFKVNGRPLISSYLGKCLGSDGWEEIKQRTNGYLMPFIAEIEGQFNDWNCLDSWFWWVFQYSFGVMTWRYAQLGMCLASRQRRQDCKQYTGECWYARMLIVSIQTADDQYCRRSRKFPIVSVLMRPRYSTIRIVY